MQKRRSKRQNWSDIRKKVHRVLREICDEFRDEVCTASEIVDRAMKRLRLPMNDPTAVYLMREGLRQLENHEMRRAYANPQLVTKEEDEEQINLFADTLQDKYVRIRDDKYVQVPRLQLTEFEAWEIVKQLRKIGGRYYAHADELQKEILERFPKAANE